jgi:uncharacterized protein (TIGR03067 family)
MRQFLLSIILLASPVVGVGDDQPMDTVTEKLSGRWEIVAGTNQGRELTSEDVDGTYITVINNLISTFDADDRECYRAVFTVDQEKNPIEITMRAVPEMARLGEQLPREKSIGQKEPLEAVSAGILKFGSEDRCTLCYALPGTDRPKKFHSPEGSNLMLFTLERQELEPVTPKNEPVSKR